MKAILTFFFVAFFTVAFSQSKYKVVEQTNVAGKTVVLAEFSQVKYKGQSKWACLVNGQVVPLKVGYDYYPALNSWSYVTKKDLKLIGKL